MIDDYVLNAMPRLDLQKIDHNSSLEGNVGDEENDNLDPIEGYEAQDSTGGIAENELPEAPAGEKSCAACTMFNPASATKCNICETDF